MNTLKRYLERKKLTHQAFAERLGVGQPHVTKVVSGVRGASIDLLAKIHEETRIPLKTLIAESKPDRRSKK
jgi:transcriptional regulator with XRE-family HTH domain